MPSPIVLAARSPQPGFVGVSIRKAVGSSAAPFADQLAIEEPLEIRLVYGPPEGRVQKSISITMRTPGHDAELAAGFLLTEGMIRDASAIERIRPCGPPVGELKLHNVVRVELRANVEIDLKRLERHFYTTSSCGVCGKTSIEALQVATDQVLRYGQPQFAAATIHGLPAGLRQLQAVFEQTGGLHAAALFDADGHLSDLREDVGRHNAVDKLIGTQLLAGRLPLCDFGMMVSGRASFELMQKAVMAGIPLLAAVGAPSSLALEMARRFDMTLLGFVRDGRFNIYHDAGRIRLSDSSVAG